ncbi:MAG: tryptophan synthase subunit alpha [Spirochaetia bacterium]|nr:tryptophan synthase subunit alpha [Spirochaetia bacterium]
MRELITDHLQRTGMPLLIGYLPSFYPDPERYRAALSCCAEHGLSSLEIGIPSRDPYLDGEVIRQALSQLAVPKDLLPKLITDSVEAVAAEHIRSIVMLYDETLEAVGIPEFARSCIASQAAAVLVPNITEAHRELLHSSLQGSSVEIVSFIGFDKSEEQIAHILACTTGFVYLQSTEGSTGGQFTASNAAKSRFEAVKRMAEVYDLPVALGFGISTAADVHQAAAMGADAVIIGTAFVKAAASDLSRFSSYLSTFDPYLKKERPLCST